MRRFWSISVCLFLMICPILSYAAEVASVRFSQKQDYERLVFEWSNTAPEYHLSEHPDYVEMTFSAPVSLNTDEVRGADAALIEGLDIQSPQKVKIVLNPYKDIRQVRFGPKIILDIYGQFDSATTRTVDIQERASTSGAEKPTPEKTAAEQPAVPVSLKQVSRVRSPEKKEAPKQTVLEKATTYASDVTPTALVVSSIEGVQLAAYERFGTLWVVVSRPDLNVKPFLEGEHTDLFAPLTSYEVADGTATLWKVPLPKGYHVTAEGGSLYWRLFLSPQKRANPVPSAAYHKTGVTAHHVRGGDVTFETKGDTLIMAVTDPDLGDSLSVVLTDTAELHYNSRHQFVDFDVLPSPVGLAFLAKSDGVHVGKKTGGVHVTMPAGLALTPDTEVSKSTYMNEAGHRANAPKEDSLFDFKEWQMGPRSALRENQQLLMGALYNKSTAGKAERLLSIAKLNLAHGFGVEARGFANYAMILVPQLERSPAFLALRGVASYLSAQYDLAIEDLVHPELANNEEIQLWKAATLAHLGDWQQAMETLPRHFDVLNDYPDDIAVPLALTLAEIALRNGDKETGEEIIARLEAHPDHLSEKQKNGISYLKAEVMRQNGDQDEAIALWTKLSKEEDPYYRTKSELSLVAMGLEKKTLKPVDAVNRLEALRFVWRGDDLEIQVLRRLGLAEIEAARYLDGFKTLRDAVVLSNNEAINDMLADLMRQTYEDIFLTDKIEEVSPLDLAVLYEEFRELTPSGEKGDRLVARLAERLVDVDLFERAANLLAYQIDYRLTGELAVSTALRMASIQLQDRRPEKALQTVNKAETLLKKQNFPNKALKQKDLDMLRARALSDSGDVSGALTVLDDMTPPSLDISRLAADIAWKAGRWNEAASYLRELVMGKEYTSETTLTSEDAQLLLNYAISLNLSGQRTELGNIRLRHLEQMKGFSQGELFDVVSRPRQDVMLGDRDSMMKVIGETEIFTDFLEQYKAAMQ